MEAVEASAATAGDEAYQFEWEVEERSTRDEDGTASAAVALDAAEFGELGRKFQSSGGRHITLDSVLGPRACMGRQYHLRLSCFGESTDDAYNAAFMSSNDDF